MFTWQPYRAWSHTFLRGPEANPSNSYGRRRPKSIITMTPACCVCKLRNSTACDVLDNPHEWPECVFGTRRWSIFLLLHWDKASLKDFRFSFKVSFSLLRIFAFNSNEEKKFYSESKLSLEKPLSRRHSIQIS